MFTYWAITYWHFQISDWHSGR